MQLRAIVFTSALAFAGAHAFAQTTGPSSPEQATPASAPLITAQTTSLACYFRNTAGNVTWKWGLAPGNQWYQLSGDWQTTPYSKLQKFFTSTTTGPMNDACSRSKAYYSLTDYSVIAYFAADSSAGYNYPIVSCGVELYPQY